MSEGAGDARKWFAALMREQSEWCNLLGSPLYANLSTRIAEDIEAGGRSLDVLRGHEQDRKGTMLALRLLGAVHRLVLQGSAPALARHYPSVGGDGDAEAAWRELARALEEHKDDLRAFVELPVQTNEVGRSAVLLCGFSHIAERLRMPLSLLEVGASGGLNLRWDRFFYDSGRETWGKPDSLVKITSVFELPHPPFVRAIDIVDRRGCDRNPVDPTTPEGELTLKSYVWADQEQRFQQLDGAIRIARSVPAHVERSGAFDWLTVLLETLRPGATTVVYHSVVWQYIAHDERRAIVDLFERVGAQASSDSALAWLRFEPPGDATPEISSGSLFELRLSLWPGEKDVLIARAGPHGRPVRWLDSDSSRMAGEG